MKKILFVTESLSRGGMEKMQVTIANALAERGFDVTVLCYDKRDELRADLLPSVKYIYKPRKEFPVRSKLPYIHRYYRVDKPLWEKRASAETLYKYYVGNEKYDVEIAFYRGPAIKIISGSTNKNSKKLAWVHTDFKLCDIKTVIGWFNDMDEAKQGYAKFDNICCVSHQARISFEEVVGCKEKTCTVYNMIPCEKIVEMSKDKCPLSHDKFTIVTVGRLIPDKCIDRLLSATKKLNEDGYDFNVWIVGSGRIDDELKQYCIDNGLSNVTFTGMQDNPYKYMSNADLFVLCSRREGFALVIPEAMACGTPVLSTECTGPVEILDNGKYGILAENSDDGIYSCLKNIMADKKCLDNYKGNLLLRANYFDENIIVKNLINLF